MDGRRLRAALWVSGAALVVHLVPLLLPRELPEVELQLARAVPDPRYRLVQLDRLMENPRATAAHLREAALLALPASLERARGFLAEAERRGPGEVMENQLLRARLCRAANEPECARSALAAARAAAPASPAPELTEADFAEEDGRTEVALAALGRAHQKGGAEVDLTLRYARALNGAGRIEPARALIATLEGRLPARQLLLEQGLLALARVDHPGARAHFAAAAAADPGSALPRYYLGVAAFREGDWVAAEAALREADLLDPADYRPLALLCALQREEGRLDEASTTRALLDRRLPERREEYREACPP